MQHTIEELEAGMGFKAEDDEAIECLNQHDVYCYIAFMRDSMEYVVSYPEIDYDEEDALPERVLGPSEISKEEFLARVREDMLSYDVPHEISREASDAGQLWMTYWEMECLPD